MGEADEHWLRKMVEGSEVIAVARFSGEPRWESHHADLELTGS